MKTMTVEEWRIEAKRLGGGDYLAAPFVCPLCKHIATPQDFIDAEANPNQAYQECIGRVTGAKGGLRLKLKKNEPMPQPCDWAAYGLFGTLGKGIEVRYPDGHTVSAFDFAEVP